MSASLPPSIRPAETPRTARKADRRTLFKAGGACAAAVFAPHLAQGQVTAPRPASPATSPWLEELTVQDPIQPDSSLSPTPLGTANAEECGRDPHPAWGNFAPVKLYRVDVKKGSHKFHPDLPSQDVWAYDGKVPGPLFHARYGEPILVRFRNSLPTEVAGYGSPDISVHLHNMHTPSESDGYPTDWFGKNVHGPTLTRGGEYKDHHYPMVYAGLDAFGGIGDPREALGTLWYHDHRLDFTAPNVYRGMAGFFLAFDHIDSGNENDDSATALRLPSGRFDVPLMIGDKQFDSSGYLMFDQLNTDGFVGDKLVVNGKIQPVFHVAPRKYRFRILDAATARIFDLQLRHQNQPQPFWHIASDGNLMQNPLIRSSVTLGPSERADIVVDFAGMEGTEMFLVNRLQQLDGRKAEKDFLRTPVPMLKFVVDQPMPAGGDPSRVPNLLREQPPIDRSIVAQTRNFSFDRSGGVWTINDRVFNNKPIATPKLGTAEIWNLRNLSGGWAHPVHIHFEEGRILTRNGREPPAHERGRKDTFLIGPNENVSVYLRFRDFPGKYLMHCHNSIHEDHAMMGRYDILP